jgi:hypothetical protein
MTMNDIEFIDEATATAVLAVRALVPIASDITAPVLAWCGPEQIVIEQGKIWCIGARAAVGGNIPRVFIDFVILPTHLNVVLGGKELLVVLAFV